MHAITMLHSHVEVSKLISTTEINLRHMLCGIFKVPVDSCGCLTLSVNTLHSIYASV